MADTDTAVDTGVDTTSAPATVAAPAAAPMAAAAPAAPAAQPDAKGVWPEDWRQRFAGEGADEKVVQRFQRYGSPSDVAKALIAAQAKISSGELKPVLGKNASPEEVAAWRTEHGIPEAPEKYDLAGVAFDEPDKPLINEVLKAAHSANMTPEQTRAVVKVWPDIKRAAMEARAEQDVQAQAKSEESLRQEWGPDFRRHMNLITGLLDLTASPELKDKFFGGRLADGTPIGSSPEALKMLLSLALINNPAGVVVPNVAGNQMEGVNEEIGKIEKVMRENRGAYNKDEAMQERYRNLLTARETLKTRG